MRSVRGAGQSVITRLHLAQMMLVPPSCSDESFLIRDPAFLDQVYHGSSSCPLLKRNSVKFWALAFPFFWKRQGGFREGRTYDGPMVCLRFSFEHCHPKARLRRRSGRAARC